MCARHRVLNGEHCERDRKRGRNLGYRKSCWEAYSIVIERFHKFLAPRTYLEIGVFEGNTLKLANCKSIAIDPAFRLKASVLTNKEMCHFYQMGSDEFFKTYSPLTIFGQQIDLAFLDGMHWYEYLLRDFLNVEKYCKKNSVLILHDCIPVDEFVGRRLSNDFTLQNHSINKEWWGGDVWKAVAILQKYRVDLHIVALDAPPTGLILVTNLNPSSQVIPERYFEIIGEFRNKTLKECGEEYIRGLKIETTKNFSSPDMISLRFWI